MKHLEDSIQFAVVAWARLRSCTCPPLALLYHIPNGGSRGRLEAVRLKRGGVLAGMPDLALPVARSGYHGLWLELKTPTGRVSPEQAAIHRALEVEGHRVVVCRSRDAAVAEICAYLGIR